MLISFNFSQLYHSVDSKNRDSLNEMEEGVLTETIFMIPIEFIVDRATRRHRATRRQVLTLDNRATSRQVLTLDKLRQFEGSKRD